MLMHKPSKTVNRQVRLVERKINERENAPLSIVEVDACLMALCN